MASWIGCEKKGTNHSEEYNERVKMACDSEFKQWKSVMRKNNMKNEYDIMQQEDTTEM